MSESVRSGSAPEREDHRAASGGAPLVTGPVAAGLAHDVRNLLAAIEGYAARAAAEIPATEGRAHLIQIHLAAAHAVELLQELDGRSPSNGQIPVDLEAICEEAVATLGALAPPGVRLRSRRESAVATALGSRPKLRQVALNLITNALEAAGPSRADVEVAVGTVDQGTGGDANRVFLEVRDTGRGMDAATLNRAFEPRFSTAGEGRGVGLATVQRIVDEHDGKLDVTSEPGQGSVFRVELPGVAARPAAVEDQQATARWRGSGTVLLVDDQQAVRDVVQRYLELMGFDVVVAPDGFEAVDRFAEQREQIVAILMDVTLPRLSGPAALAEIAALDPGARAIVMTGHGPPDIDDREAQSIVAGYLEKPFHAQELRQALLRVIGAPTAGNDERPEARAG